MSWGPFGGAAHSQGGFTRGVSVRCVCVRVCVCTCVCVQCVCVICIPGVPLTAQWSRVHTGCVVLCVCVCVCVYTCVCACEREHVCVYV